MEVFGASWISVAVQQSAARRNRKMDTLGFEPRAFRMRSGCDTTTPCAPCSIAQLGGCISHRSPSDRASRALGMELTKQYQNDPDVQCKNRNAAGCDGSRDSSVGRASDRRSEGPRFDPGSRHIFYLGGGSAACVVACRSARCFDMGVAVSSPSNVLRLTGASMMRQWPHSFHRLLGLVV